MTIEITEEQQQVQRETVDRLRHSAVFAVDSFVLAHRDELRSRVTPAAATSLVVWATISYLVGEGLIREVPTDERNEWLRVAIPEHLMPDVAAYVAEYDRIRKSMDTFREATS